MANINPSIVGEPYKDYVKDQIKIRQKIHGAGLGSDTRTPEEIAYLNSKNSWIKCASSVSIEDSSRLTNIGLNGNLKGTELAKKFVLFNGIQDYNNPTDLRGGYSSKSDNPQTSGLVENALPNSLYGIGGLDFGQQPMPGILDFTLTHNDIGSIRFGQLKIRANNKLQFEILELLYVRLGYTIFVEWGNNMYFENSEKKRKPVGTVEVGQGSFGEFGTEGQLDQTSSTNIGPAPKSVGTGQINTRLKYTGVDTVTLIDDGTWFDPPAELLTHLGFFQKIEEKREEFQGNYDAFFGRVVNFDWTFHPSGYYEIDLVLRDLGDVVESFKVNALTKKNTVPNFTENNETEQTQANQDDVRNYLYCLQNTLEENNPFNSEENNSDYVNVKEYENVLDPNINMPQNTLYIRFGAFLEWLEKNIIPHITNQSKTFPMVSVSTSDTNYMRTFPGFISTNPGVCVIKNDFLGEFEKKKIGSNYAHDKLFSNFRSINVGDNPYLGKIMNIYLNIGTLENTFKNLLGSSNTVDVDLLSLLNTVLTNVNKCFGNYVDLRVGIQEGNVLVIRDTKLESRVGTDGERFEKEEEDKEGIIKVFGYDPDSLESNFVKNFRFNTRISNQLASQITIGAASNRTNTTNVSGFFENLNLGLKDRFQEKSSDNNPDEETEPFIESCRAGESNKNISSSDLLKIAGAYLKGAIKSGGVGPITPDFSGTDFSSDSSKPEDKKDQTDIEIARENLSEAGDTYFQLLSIMFGTEDSITEGGEFDTKHFKYFEFNSEGKREARLSSALQKFLGASKVFLEKEIGSSLASTTLGFIPIDINLTLDGISGIKIYNQLSIDSEFLPKPYPEVIDFVIMNVTHRISNNAWETEIRAISKPNVAKTDIEAVNEILAKEEEQASEQQNQETPEEDEDLTFFPPLGNLSLNIRNDDQGAGSFGAPRSTSKKNRRTHEGIDLSTVVPPSRDINIFAEYPNTATNKNNANLPTQTGTVAPTTALLSSLYSGRGTQVFAPIDGRLLFWKSDKDSVLPGAKIIGTGKYTGYVVKIFYFAPEKKLYGQQVKKGNFIGNAIQVDLQKNYQGVTNHIHYGVEKLNKAINPQDLKYSLEK